MPADRSAASGWGRVGWGGWCGGVWWEPGPGGEQLGECVEGVGAVFGGGGQVGPDDGEVGEALQGALGAAACALFDFDGPDFTLGGVVCERYGQVGEEPQDHLAVGVEPVSQRQGALLGRGTAGGRVSRGSCTTWSPITSP